MRTTIALHGNAVSFAETPSSFEQVDGIPWTDIVGLRTGSGSKFRGRSNSMSWFHYPLAPLASVNGTAYGLQRLQIMSTMDPGAVIDHVHVWDRTNRIFARDGLRASGDVDLPLPSALPTAGDLSVSLGLRFSSAASVLFRGLIAHYVSIMAPPVCGRVAATLSGTITMHTSNGNALGPYTEPLQVGLNFDSDCQTVSVTSFTPISVTFPTPLGNNTSTFTMQGGGIGTMPRNGTRNFSMPLVIGLDNSLEGSNPDSWLTVTLASAPIQTFRGPLSGTPLQLNGAIVLVATGRFRGGFLHGSDATLVLDGRISPTP